jgi:acyl-CoA synthetase (AMP-forming)/AMP-acid ligase II
MMTSQDLRHEVHFGRIVRCFAERPANVDMLLRQAAGRRPEGAAVIWSDARLSYSELDEQVERIAAAWARRGLRQGDRVALLLGNRPEFLLAVLAAARMGAIVVPINVRQRRPEIQFMLAHSQSAALVFDRAFAGELPQDAELPDLRLRFVVGGTTAAAEPFAELLQSAPSPSSMAPGEDEPFCILYTSGTTGRPKGATLTHLGAVHSALHFQRGLGIREGEVAALAVPASHVTGLVAILLTMLRVAGAVIFLPSFKAGDFLDLVQKERVNYTLMVPAMYNLCLLEPRFAQADLSSWRVGGFGGAPMPAATIAKLAEAAPGLRLSNIYGATETTSPATILPPGDATHFDTVGLALPCADIIVVDRAGREVPAGQMGELLIAGPMTIPFYWNNPEATASNFVGGYWRSGDIGSVDVAGYVRIHDRMKDVVNRGGYKIYCIEVENVIARYPGVEECAVVGYPDSVLGERVAAFVHGPSTDAAAQIHEYCAANLSDYKVPEVVRLLEQPLPRNANGKVVKDELRRLLGPGR